MKYRFFFPLAILLLFSNIGLSQVSPFTYSNPNEYRLSGITVSGVQFLDPNIIVNVSGLYLGDTITVPGEDISNAINKLWDQGLFSDVKITASRIEDKDIYLDIYLQELARISAVEITGLKRSDEKDVRDLIKLRVGGQATENVLDNATRLIKNHFRSKAYLNTTVDIHQENDTVMANGVRLNFIIDKGPKVRISDIIFKGNENISDRRLRRAMDNTHRHDWNIFKSSKFVERDFEEDKYAIIDYYNEKGFRDAKVLRDSIYDINEKRIGITIWIEEGPKYFYRNVKWVGNSKLPDEVLDNILGIRKGDAYDKKHLEERLYIDETSVTTTYMDDGYLFFHIEPVEVRVKNDSIDLEMRIFEGDQATINSISIVGNTKTHENVIRRELRTKPGDLFSKTNITRSIRELATLGHFDPEKLDVRPIPNPADGTVDLTYIVEEKANDQLEISGGWGANMFVGTIGIRFSNFSMGRVFEKGAWRPVPSGDSQTLSLRAQTNGSFYKAFSLTFVEPWLGGKKPTNFTISLYHTIQNTATWLYQISDQSMKVTGGAIGIGTRLQKPDDFFTFYNEVSYQRYSLTDWQGYFIFSNGISNNLSYKAVLSRNSIDQLIYPRRGSNFSLSVQVTPPYSLIDGKDYSEITVPSEKYKWIEYHKWKGEAKWFQPIVGDLVLYAGAEFGYLGYFNPDIGYSPFEGFDLGGDGMSGYNLYGRETIGLRGYNNGSLTPPIGNVRAANVYNKFTTEIRFPISLQAQAAIYVLGFLEAGNAWYDFNTVNPFNIHRSAGVGARLFLPMIGMLGIDWGYGFDQIPHNPEAHRGQFHFVIGMPF